MYLTLLRFVLETSCIKLRFAPCTARRAFLHLLSYSPQGFLTRSSSLSACKSSHFVWNDKINITIRTVFRTNKTIFCAPLLRRLGAFEYYEGLSCLSQDDTSISTPFSMRAKKQIVQISNTRLFESILKSSLKSSRIFPETSS